jgi:hydroxymethylpyrimidine pyrophosphatase-like HAD family hydrolase
MEPPPSQSARQEHRGCWFASPVTDTWNMTASPMQSAEAMCWSCLPPWGVLMFQHRHDHPAGTFPSGRCLTMKKLIVFDLDGTIAESKSPLDAEMATLLGGLLAVVKVAIISGGNWPQFQRQVLNQLAQGLHLKQLSILPTCGTKFYRYESSWKLLYSEDFSVEEKEKIIRSLQQTLAQSGFATRKIWGQQIEDRGSQITFSALGQEAPIDPKEKWDPDFSKRKQMNVFLDTLIPDFPHISKSLLAN